MTEDCLEIIEEIAEIYPIPCGVLSYQFPWNVRKYGAPVSNIVIADTNTNLTLDWLRQQRGLIVQELCYYNVHAQSLLIDNKPKVKVSFKTSVAGEYYQVALTANSKSEADKVVRFCEYVKEYEYFDTLLVDTLDNVYLVRGMYPATEIKSTINIPRHNQSEISINIECINGVQSVEI